MLGDRPAIARLELAAFVYVERNLTRRNTYVTDLAFNAQTAGGKIKLFM